MFWDSWFVAPKVELPKQEEQQQWTSVAYTQPKENNFHINQLKVMADSEGHLTLDFNGNSFLRIPAEARHAFLEKLQRAVEMADLADPKNEPLMKSMEETK